MTIAGAEYRQTPQGKSVLDEPRRTTAILPVYVQASIGTKLRQIYENLPNDALPPDLAGLIDRLIKAQAEEPEAKLRKELIETLPFLRSFALSLTNDWDKSQDIVQETLLRAIKNIHKFQPGTDMKAWLSTILRNEFLRYVQKRSREVEDIDGAFSSRLSSPPEQMGRVSLIEAEIALSKLSTELRDAVLSIGLYGLSYHEVAEISGVPTGTIKSRVNRARMRLAELLALQEIEDLGSDQTTRAVLSTNAFIV
jgi:RNA polymerase sigma-70 factor (ECF subfamily)